ncbi:YhbY family RNA-binding protein [Candidatus Woesearchaeota archaeon]|nr:YhbY family RNA-binding protein [Candidatus Woesearchaeota archaeon]
MAIPSRSKAHVLDPSVRIGKSGLSDGMMQEIKRQLDKRKMIKIKFLPNFEAAAFDEAVLKITSTLGARVVQKMGKILVVEKARRPIRAE